MSIYLFLNILIISIPLILSFEKRVHYIRQWPEVFLSVLVVGSIYVFWDVLATARGHWSFNSAYVGSIKIFNLPLEEILFFITTPFSCLFIYEVVKYFKKDRKIRLTKRAVFFSIYFLLFLSFVFIEQEYTALAFIFSAGFIFLTFKIRPDILSSSIFWQFLGICYIPFFIFNGILTGLPIVLYGSQFITGIRIFTIPIEDFFYNFSYLGFSLLSYKIFLSKTNK